MSWAPNDLVSDFDLSDYEPEILKKFGQVSWQGLRTKALEDWLFPILKGQGLDPYKLRTRYTLDAALSYTASVYTDQSSAIKDTTADDLNLAAVFATAGTDAFYLGSVQPFRGIFVRMLDTVASASNVLSAAYWNGNWENLLLADGTIQTAGRSFSASGSVTWLLPMDWITRIVSTSSAYYWVKLTVSATPTSAKAGQIGAIRGSVFRAPVTFRTLELVMRAAPTGQDGPWKDKADFYAQQADQALQRALAIAGGDFDTDASDLVDSTEASQTTAEAGGLWTMERM